MNYYFRQNDEQNEKLKATQRRPDNSPIGSPPPFSGGQQPNFPGGPPPNFPGGPQPNFPGGPQPNFPGGPQPNFPGGTPPNPPQITPVLPPMQGGEQGERFNQTTYGRNRPPQQTDLRGLRRCLYRHTYVWLRNGHNFWFFPIYIIGPTIIGFQWRNNRWVNFSMNIRSILHFQCF